MTEDIKLKRCTVCKETKSLDCYYANKRSADKKGYRCKKCDDAARTASRAQSEGTALGYRRRMLDAKYGLTLEGYAELLARQNGCCAICGTDNPVGEGNSTSRKTFSFAVDHCHESGKVRGLLCNTCNRALGFLKDSVDLLEKATAYLKATCH